MTIEQKRIYHRLWYSRNKDKSKGYRLKSKIHKQEYDKNRYQENKEEIKIRNRRYYQEHREQLLITGKKWIKKNKIRYRDYRRVYDRQRAQEKRKSDYKFRLNSNIRTAVWGALKENKAERHWETLVGYTLQDLIRHLENLFDDKMNWDNYGVYEKGKFKWHIDHIKPQSLFYYKTAEDPEFRKCWGLKNLQPLEAMENIIKSNHYL